MKMKTTMAVLFLFLVSQCFAKLDYQNEIELLMGARELDQYEFCHNAGVCIGEETPLDPHFTGLRVDSCIKRVWYFESTAVVLPCFASFADKISWQYYSRMRQVQRGIDLYNTGEKTKGTGLIYANLARYISLREEPKPL